jgi:uncharacterized glyoxalase superfamily protein PhnB
MFIPAVFYKQPKAALRWLEDAFGFELTLLVEGPEGDERYLHSELSLHGQGRLMVGGEWADWVKSPASIGGSNTQSLRVQLPSGLDAHCERARGAGAVILAEPKTEFYGDRTYRCTDPEGHNWTFAERVQELSVAEMEKAGGVKFKSSL